MRDKTPTHSSPSFFQPTAVPWCFPRSPLNRRNQYTLAFLYLHEYFPELCMFFSSTVHSKSFGSLSVAGMTLLYICFCKGSEQVNMLLLSFTGIFSLHVMYSSSPLMAANTVLSSCIPARGHSALVQMENVMIVLLINKT